MPRATNTAAPLRPSHLPFTVNKQTTLYGGGHGSGVTGRARRMLSTPNGKLGWARGPRERSEAATGPSRIRQGQIALLGEERGRQAQVVLRRAGPGGYRSDLVGEGEVRPAIDGLAHLVKCAARTALVINKEVVVGDLLERLGQLPLGRSRP